MQRDRFKTYAWIVIAATLAVILWGAYVRASGSGAGCGSHWPLCNGEVLPRSPSVETIIEFTHRLTSGVAFLMVVALLVWCLRIHPKGHPVRHAAVLTMIFMVGEAAIGAGLVLFEMVAGNESIARAFWMMAHLVNTFLLLAALTLTAHWGGGEPPAWRRPTPRELRRLIGLALAGTVLIGASGAVAALGDTIFPPTSLGEELRQDFSASVGLLKQLRVLHPLIAVVASLALIQLSQAVRKQDLGAEVKGYAKQLQILVFVQLGVGVVNILLLAPIRIQLVHLLLADVLWIVLVLTCASILTRAATGRPAGAAA